ncbi:MAG: hypothetical protein AAGH15_00285 [Myxococcota bacterium]
MGFLLAKIALLLVIAALLGALLAYWWLRRGWEDVSADYEALKRTSKVQRDHAAVLEREATRMRELAAADASTVDALAGIGTNVMEVRERVAQLDALHARLDRVDGLLGEGLRREDLGGTTRALQALEKDGARRWAEAMSRLEDLGGRLGALEARPAGSLDAVMLRMDGMDARLAGGAVAPVLSELATLDGRRRDDAERMHKRLSALEGRPSVDGEVLTARLDGFEAGLRGLAERPHVDLAPLEARIDALAARPPVDLAPLDARLGALESRPSADGAALAARLDALEERLATMADAPGVDLAPLEARIGALAEGPGVNLAPLEARLAALAEGPGVDLGPLEARLAALETRPTADGAAIRERIDALEARLATLGEAPAVDLGPLESRLAALAERPSVDLGPLEARLAALRNGTPVDLGPLEARLEALDAQLGTLAGAGLRRDDLLAQLAARLEDAPAAAVAPGTLLKDPSFGLPDDLKRISGVGPKLERLLHRTGVFYFWQIGEWTPEDVARVDTLLDVFKGRIARDDWVPQAARLAQEPGAAPRPPRA